MRVSAYFIDFLTWESVKGFYAVFAIVTFFEFRDAENGDALAEDFRMDFGDCRVVIIEPVFVDLVIEVPLVGLIFSFSFAVLADFLRG